jgi:hypothetical protein
MSRSGYSDDCDGLALWRYAVGKAIDGKRGQAFLRETLAALDALPAKRLISGTLICDGECCALGAVALKRGTDVTDVDSEDCYALSDTFGIAGAMAAEIMYVNDEVNDEASPEERFAAVRKWVLANINVQPGEIAELTP